MFVTIKSALNAYAAWFEESREFVYHSKRPSLMKFYGGEFVWWRDFEDVSREMINRSERAKVE